MRYVLKKTLIVSFFIMLANIISMVSIVIDKHWVLFSNVVYAQQDNKKTRRVPTMSEKTYKKLTKAQEAIEAKQYQQALTMLNGMLKQGGYNGYEVAQIHSYVGYVYADQGKYSLALSAYEKVIKEKQIPEGMEIGTLYTMAQLYLGEERYKDAVRVMKRWFQLSATPNGDAYALMATAYFQLKQYGSAENEIEEAFAYNKKNKWLIKENWLQLGRAIYYENDNEPKLTAILKDLIVLYPKNDYFVQLSAIYGEQNKEKEQLLLLEVGYDGGYLTSAGALVTLASLLLQADVPYKAAMILDKGMKKRKIKESVTNLKLLANAWLLAQDSDKAIAVFEKAAKKSTDGELYIKLGDAYVAQEQWKNAIDSVKTGISKGGLKRPYNAHTTLGMAYFNVDDLELALTHFRKAASTLKTYNAQRKEKDKDLGSQKFISNWTTFVTNEKIHREQLTKAGL